MSYIGAQPTTAAFVTDTFSANGSGTVFTLSVAPANTNSILVAVSGVLQDPSTYSVSGTTLTFSAAPPAGTGNISVRFLGIPASGVVNTAYRTVTEFTATAGQTTFSVPSYTVGYIDVYRNGALLGSADFTATNGTTVVLANAASAGDLVEVISFSVSSVLNAIPNGVRSVNTSNLPVGTVLQVVQATFTGTQTISPGGVNANWTDVTSLSLNITPSSSSNKVLLISQINAQAIADRIIYARFVGGNAGTYIGNSAGSRSRVGAFLTTPGTAAVGGTISMNYLDSPSTTSTITYKVQLAPNFSTGDVAVNYNIANDGDFAYIPRGACSLLALEIAG